MKTAKPVVKGNKLVFTVESNIVAGTDRMIAITGGVRASVGKTKEGKTVVTSYQFDRDRFPEDSATKWLEKNSETIEKAVAKVQEGNAAGSFQDITMRIQSELNEGDLFPANSYGGSSAYLCYVFADYCVVDYNGDFYSIDYTDEGSEITLSNPKQVDMTFVAKEAAARNEKVKRSIRANMSFGLDEKAIKEVDEATDKRELVVCLIEAGKNFSKKRYYPKETLKEAAGLFAGLKMYLDHPTAKEEQEKPERSLEKWVSTIKESWYEDGKILGIVKVHNIEFWNKLKEDEVFRNNVAVSINASGKRYEREIDGSMMEVIEAILNPKSVDWVTEPGARGRVEYILESEKRREREEDITMLKTVTLEEVQKDRPDLIESIKKSLEVEGKKATEAAIVEAIKLHDEKKVKEAEAAKLKEGQTNKIKQLVGAAKLPKTAIERVCEKLLAETFADDAAIEKRVKEAVEAELAYIAEVGGKKIGVATGAAEETKEVKENVTTGFEKRFGLTEAELKKARGEKDVTEVKETGKDAKSKVAAALESAHV